MEYELEIVAADNNLCGEAPTWNAEKERIIWVDAESSLVYELGVTAREKRILNRGLMVAGIALNRNGGMIFAGATGLHLWYGQDDYRTIVCEHGGEALVFNDIIAAPNGSIYAGTYYWGANGMEKTGKLYMIDTDGSARVMDEGIKLSNGLGFSPCERILYYADSGARRIYAYDFDAESGDLTNRRIFVETPPDAGIPDGLTVDVEGYVWCAQWYGGQVVRYDPAGKVERRIAMPVKQVSSVTFGGRDLRDLYVTTAAEYWPSDLIPPGFCAVAPMGGSLYRMRLDISGKPEYKAEFQRPVF